MERNEYQAYNSVIYEGEILTVLFVSNNVCELSNGVLVPHIDLSPIHLSEDNINETDSCFINKSSGLLHVNVDNVKIAVNLSSGVCLVEDEKNPKNGNTYHDVFCFHILQNIIYSHVGRRLVLEPKK